MLIGQLEENLLNCLPCWISVSTVLAHLSHEGLPGLTGTLWLHHILVDIVDQLFNIFDDLCINIA